ncbi:MAG: C-3',4' desaturase CrtD [Cyanobacteria bacterium P01_C01_bin.89]
MAPGLADSPARSTSGDRPPVDKRRSSGKSGDKSKSIVIIGAGIGGLTAGALLAKRGYKVDVFDLGIVPGGCASTFKRRGFTFDVGATQVAGLEPGGIHHRIFEELGIPLPEATPCDPACAVFLPGESEPISVWRDPDKWQAERQRQFPGSEPFWNTLNLLFRRSWEFQGRDPILPPYHPWDAWQLVKALRPETLVTVPFTFSTVGDLLRQYGLEGDRRLKTFMDIQLKLYSQVNADETALLYAATALGVSQAPLGLYHLEGSMQVLSDRLTEALTQYGGKLHLRHRVESIQVQNGRVTGLTVRPLNSSPKSKAEHKPSYTVKADTVVANVPVQNLVKLVDNPQRLSPVGGGLWSAYRARTERLENPSGAFVLYLGVEQAAIPENCPPHLQFLYDYDGPVGENNSLFVSVSNPGDGRAPDGKATIIASSFTDIERWDGCSDDEYARLKAEYTAQAIAQLRSYFHLTPDTIVYQEAATPRSFVDFTGRDRGMVGGVGMRLSTFGPFGYGNRTPIPGLWMVGDSTHPGEGTAGVSYSAWTVVRQLEAAIPVAG